MNQIAFITDIHLDEQFPIDQGINAKENWMKTLNDLVKKGVKDIVFGGDIGDPSAHFWFFETLRSYKVHLVLGNHDRYEHVSKYYSRGDDPQELYYTTEDDGFKYIFLDTSLDYLSQTQLLWLKSELDTLKRLILFMHHPIIAVDTPVDRLYPLANREEVRALLIENAKPITVFCGHYHMNYESSFKNITQVITQASSYQIVRQTTDVEVDLAKFGYKLIQLDGEGIASQCIEFGYE